MIIPLFPFFTLFFLLWRGRLASVIISIETYNAVLSTFHGTDARLRLGRRLGQAADHYAEDFTWEIGLATDRGLEACQGVSYRLDFPG